MLQIVGSYSWVFTVLQIDISLPEFECGALDWKSRVLSTTLRTPISFADRRRSLLYTVLRQTYQVFCWVLKGSGNTPDWDLSAPTRIWSLRSAGFLWQRKLIHNFLPSLHYSTVKLRLQRITVKSSNVSEPPLLVESSVFLGWVVVYTCHYRSLFGFYVLFCIIVCLPILVLHCLRFGNLVAWLEPNIWVTDKR